MLERIKNKRNEIAMICLIQEVNKNLVKGSLMEQLKASKPKDFWGELLKETSLLFDYFIKNYLSKKGKFVFNNINIIKHIRLALYVFNMIKRLV